MINLKYHKSCSYNYINDGIRVIYTDGSGYFIVELGTHRSKYIPRIFRGSKWIEPQNGVILYSTGNQVKIKNFTIELPPIENKKEYNMIKSFIGLTK